MSIALDDVRLAFLQTVQATAGFLDRGLAHCSDTGIDPEEIVSTRLFPDMLPFRFQVLQVVAHSVGALEGVKAGVFSPPGKTEPLGYSALQGAVRDAATALETMTAADVNALAGKDMLFQFGDFKIPFTAEGFLMSFSLPNLHFHATTAYDILRMKGVPLGKRDYLGQLRIKG